jgi:hypothetical protein
MSQQVINVGAAANDHTGDPLRTAWQKANANFSELYAIPSQGGGGGGFSGLVAPSVQSSVVGNPASTTETTLLSYTLPANAVKVIGRGVKILAAGYFGTNGTRAVIRLYFGSEVFVLDKTATDGSRWNAEMGVVLIGTAPSQVFVSGRASANFLVGPYGNNPGIDMTGTVLIKVTGQSMAAAIANQAVCYQLAVGPLETDMAAAGSGTDVLTVATLPSPTGRAGSRSHVNNANATTFNSIVAGGGSNFVPVFCDGTNWRIG